MVFILKHTRGRTRIGSHEFDSTIVRLVKYMINMEYNERIFRDDGAFNTDLSSMHEDDKKFIVYKDPENGITCDVTPSSGFIMLTSLLPGFISVAHVIDDINAVYDAIAGQYPGIVSQLRLIPTSYGSFHPTTQGTILYTETIDHWNRTILVSPNNATLNKMQGSTFIWGIYEIDNCRHNLFIEEGGIRPEEIINRDLSTIIIDVSDCFVQPDLTMQLKAMRLSDIHHHERAVHSQFAISQKYGMLLQIRHIMSPGLSSTAHSSLASYCKHDMDKLTSISTFPPRAKIYECELDDLDLINLTMWKKYTIASIEELLTTTSTSTNDEVKSAALSDSDNSDHVPIKTKAKPKAKPKAPTKGKTKVTAKHVYTDSDPDEIDEMDEMDDAPVKPKKTKKVHTDNDVDEEAEEAEVVVDTGTILPVVHVAVNPDDALTKRQILLRTLGSTLKEQRNDVCVFCMAPLYGEVFVLQHIKSQRCTAMCEVCFTHCLYNCDTIINTPHCVIWKVVYPRTLVQVADDRDLVRAVKICPDIHNADAFLHILKLIAVADTKMVVQRFTTQSDTSDKKQTYAAPKGFLPRTKDEAERWQFLFSGRFPGKQQMFTLYMINDTAFCMSDYDLLAGPQDVTKYIILGGLC